MVVSDLVSCLEDNTLPLMQFSEAFAVVQVRELPPLEGVFLLLSECSTYVSYSRKYHHCNFAHASPRMQWCFYFPVICNCLSLMLLLLPPE